MAVNAICSNSAPSAAGSGAAYSTNSKPSVPSGLSQSDRAEVAMMRLSNDFHAGKFLLRLEQRRHILVAQAQQVGVDQALMHRLADDCRHRQRFGEVRVVAQVLHRVDERELEAGHVALEHPADHHLEYA